MLFGAKSKSPVTRCAGARPLLRRGLFFPHKSPFLPPPLKKGTEGDLLLARRASAPQQPNGWSIPRHPLTRPPAPFFAFNSRMAGQGGYRWRTSSLPVELVHSAATTRMPCLVTCTRAFCLLKIQPHAANHRSNASREPGEDGTEVRDSCAGFRSTDSRRSVGAVWKACLSS